MHWRRSLLCAAALMFALSGLLAASSGEMPITTSSPEAKTLFMKARDLADNLELESAIRLCDQAIEMDPSFAMAYVLRGSASGMQGYREGVAKAETMIDRVSPGEKLWITAEKAVAEGRPTEARQPLEDLVQMFPGDKHVHMRTAFYYMNIARDPAKAMAHLQKATTIDPSFAGAYNLIGYVHSGQEQYKSAERAFRKYIELQPDRPNPYDSYAELLMKMGRYDESIAQYRKALQKDDRFFSSLAGVGNNLVLKKDFEGARQAFEQQRAKAGDLDGQLDAMENVARSFVAEGKVDRAVETYGRIGEQAKGGQLPNRAIEASFDAAFVLTQNGKLPEAKSWVDRADSGVSEADVPPAVKARLQRTVHFARARIHTAAGDFDQARGEIDAVRPAVEEAQIPAEMRAMNEVLGSLALKQQRYGDAVQYLAKADDQNPYVLFQRAQAMAGAGQNAQAATLFKKVAEWNGNDLGYAMVRDEAREKATTAPVATAGRKKK